MFNGLRGKIDLSPFRLVRRAHYLEYRENRAVRPVTIGGVTVGGESTVVIAGPCAVESREQTLAVARQVRRAGAALLRGGAFKPRTSPYEFHGLGRKGLEILAEAREETGLPIVTEVLDPRHVELVAQFADCLQVGARSMQNFPLLQEAGQAGKPVLLKRHWAATLTEWLCAAEYVALAGNLDIVLCERGIRTFTHGDYNRNTLDLNVLVPLREQTFLPILVDPSHATGDSRMVAGAALAAIGAGADGLIIEVVADETPIDQVLCDRQQAIRPSRLAEIVEAANRWRGEPTAWSACPS